jgi:predicted nucleic acid-binding protein
MKVLFDTSVWIEHLRRGALTEVIPALRGKFSLWLDAVSAAELRAGCRSKLERSGVDHLLAPFEKAGRLAVPEAGDYVRAATALSRLRERGKTLKQPGSALLDALIAAVGSRSGAMLVTFNIDDFRMLAEVLPLRVETLADFMTRL